MLGHFAAALLVLIVIKLSFQVLAVRTGAFFVSRDETARLHYVWKFADSGDISSYEYTWLPLPMIVVGTVGGWMEGRFLAALVSTNTILCTLALLFTFASAVLVRRWRAADASSPSTIWGWPFLGALLAAAYPWQSTFSLQGYAEPFLFFGVSLGIFGGVTACKPGWRSLAGLALSGAGFAVAAGARYEAWAFGALFPLLALAITVPPLLRDSAMGRPVRDSVVFAAMGGVIGSMLAAAPILWWMLVNQSASGDPLAPLGTTHRFIAEAGGEILPGTTLLSLLEETLPREPWLPALLAIALLQRRWSLPALLLVLLPAGHLFLILLMTAKGGVPWIYGERALSLHAFLLSFGAALAAGQFASTGGTGGNRLFAMGPAALLVFILLHRTVLTGEHPPGEFEHLRQTRKLVDRALRHEPLPPTHGIVVPVGNPWYDGHELVAPMNSGIIPAPWHWMQPNSLTREDIVWWFERNPPAHLLVLPWELSPELAQEFVEESYGAPLVRSRIKSIRDKGLGIAIFTNGNVSQQLPTEVLELLRERGLSGPVFGEWALYSAFAPPTGYPGPRIESLASESQPEEWRVQLSIPPRPVEKRNGMPGTFRIGFEPTRAWSSKFQIGGDILHVEGEPGWHVVALDLRHGRIVDHFSITGDGRFAKRGRQMPWFVYRMKEIPRVTTP